MAIKIQCEDLLDSKTRQYLYAVHCNDINKAIEVAEQEESYMLPSLREFSKVNTDYYREAREVHEAYQSLSGNNLNSEICI